MVAGGHLRATDAQHQPVQLKGIAQGQVPKISFKVESATVIAAQRVKVRKLLQELGLPAKPGEELSSAERVVSTLSALAAARIIEPEATRVTLPSRTLQNAAEARERLKEVKAMIEKSLKKGPIVV